MVFHYLKPTKLLCSYKPIVTITEEVGGFCCQLSATEYQQFSDAKVG
jgi:hypothetical protein